MAEELEGPGVVGHGWGSMLYFCFCKSCLVDQNPV